MKKISKNESEDGDVYKCVDSGCDKEENNDGKYYNNDDYETAKNNPIIHCSKENGGENIKCKYENKEERDNYCVKDKKLNLCDDKCGHCIVVSDKEGLFFNKSNGNVISCKRNGESIECTEGESQTVGFHLSEDPTVPLIQCTMSLGSVVCSIKEVEDGYYVRGNKLIKCVSKVCDEFESQSGWYKNGEEGKAIIHCDNRGCNSIAIPKVGYYVNGDGRDINGKYLLKCSLNNSGKVDCSEEKLENIVRSKYFKNAADSKLIECTSESCKSIEGVNGYYINGSNNQLIYCINKDSCNEYAVSQNGWYINFDRKKLIKCRIVFGKMKCEEKEPVKGRYYLNSDSNTSNYPLIYQNGEQLDTQTNKSNGWYLNGEPEVDAETIIRCTSANVCGYQEAKSGKCNMSNAGGFIKDSDGKVKWCDGKGEAKEFVDENDKLNKENYIIGEDKKTWEEANKYCKSKGQHLITIDSQEKQKFIEPLLKTNSDSIYWIGGYRKSESKDWKIGWKWIEDDKEIEYTNWAAGEPNNYYNNNEDKIELYNHEAQIRGKWNDEKAGERRGYICEKDDIKGAEEIIVTSFSRNDFIPGINLPTGSSESYALLEISSGSILKKSVAEDLYYQYGSGMYYCPKSKKGICEALGVIKNGYIFVYSIISKKYTLNDGTSQYSTDNKCGKANGNKVCADGKCCSIYGWCGGGQSYCGNGCQQSFGQCNSGTKVKITETVKQSVTIYKCENDKCKELNEGVGNTCSNNIKIDSITSNVQLCSGIGENKIETKDLKNSNIYALKKEGNGIPGSSSTAHYIMVKVNKNNIEFIQNIEYPKGMTIGNGNCKVDKSKNVSCGPNIKYVYPSDTNYGFWEYDGTNEVYKRIFVPIKDDKENVIGKYDCEVGGLCIYKDLDKPSPVGNTFKNGILYTKYSDGSESAAKDVKPNSRHYSEGIGWILCKEADDCAIEVEEEDKGVKHDIYLNSDGVEVVKLIIELINIIASTKKSKFVFNLQIGNGSGMRKRDEGGVDGYGEIIELTHVSYSTIDGENETRNIFVCLKEGDDENNYKMITDENLPIGEGYSCSKGRCIKINREGYYLNTAQLGNNNVNKEQSLIEINPGYHQLVKCSNKIDSKTNTNEFKCEFENIVSEGYYENAVATGAGDAIIFCSTSSGCQTMEVGEVKGLLKCAGNDQGIGPKFDGSYYYESEMELTEDQYCIYNNVIYGGGEEEIDEGIHMFDVTSRKIEHSKIRETHLYASLYYCSKESEDSNIKCYQTYGFIINDNKEGYSICSSEGCKYISKLDNIPSKCDVAGNGGIIKDGDGLKFCNNNSPISIDGEEKYYPININVRDSYPGTNILDKIIVGVKDKVIFTLVEDGYILIGGNGIIKDNESDNENNKLYKLYECKAKNRICNPIENELSTYGYYKNAASKYVIICKKDGCSISEKFNTDVTFNTDDEKATYSFEETGEILDYSYIAVTKKDRKNVLLANDYILIEDGTDKLYRCYKNTGKCELQEGNGEETPYPGWYISGDGINKAYRCESSSCRAEQLRGSCTINVGELIFNTRENIYQICDKNNGAINLNNNEGLIKTITVNDKKSYKFPSEMNTILINKNSVLGIGKIVESGGSEKTESVIINQCATGKGNSHVMV